MQEVIVSIELADPKKREWSVSVEDCVVRVNRTLLNACEPADRPLRTEIFVDFREMDTIDVAHWSGGSTIRFAPNRSVKNHFESVRQQISEESDGIPRNGKICQEIHRRAFLYLEKRGVISRRTYQTCGSEALLGIDVSNNFHLSFRNWNTAGEERILENLRLICKGKSIDDDH